MCYRWSVKSKKSSVKILFTVTTIFLLLVCAALFFTPRIFPIKYRAQISLAVKETGLSEELLFAVIKAESGFNPLAVSRAGAMGLMQLMPPTAYDSARRIKMQSYDLLDVYDNILLGSSHLKYLLDKFNTLKEALAAYNAGEGVVSEWLNDKRYIDMDGRLSVIPYSETALYVAKIERYTNIYALLLKIY